jgi:hypothetical protein
MNTPEHWRPSRQFATWLTNRSAAFFRAFARLLMGFSLFLFAHAAYDEDRGIAAPPFVPSRYSRPIERRDINPVMFRALMTYEWECPFAFFMAGAIILGMVRRADRCDPFSPAFAGKAALKECERTLDAELRKKHSPLRY